MAESGQKRSGTLLLRFRCRAAPSTAMQLNRRRVVCSQPGNGRAHLRCAALFRVPGTLTTGGGDRMSGRTRTAGGLPGQGGTKRVHTLQLLECGASLDKAQEVRFLPLIDATELEKLASAGNIPSPLCYM